MRSELDLLGLGVSLPFLDELYARYRQDPGSVDPSWRPLFESAQGLPSAVIEPAAPRANGHGNGAAARSTGQAQATEAQATQAQVGLSADKVFALVNAYRSRGHLEAKLDPLDHVPRTPHPDLDPRSYGFTDADLDAATEAAGL